VTIVDGNTGQPVQQASVSFAPRNALASSDVKSLRPNTGQFTLTGVFPGSYVLTAVAGTVQTRRMGASISVDVSNTDADQLSVVLKSSVDINGRIIIEGFTDVLDSHPIVGLVPQDGRSLTQGINDFAEFHGND